jgi:DNA-binding transcriptional ArsR family regulator
MLVDRVPPILQSVAQVRNWVIENVPCTDSLLGYDLFLKLGNDVAAGKALDLDGLGRGLPYPIEQVTQHLHRLEEAGLVELATGEGGSLALRPTQRFMILLDSYSRKFDSLFIVRQEVRNQQLVVQATDPKLAELGRLLYDHVYDMGWLFLHNFGSACFLMASIMRRVAELHGHRARIASCHVEIQGPERRYLLGAPGYAKEGQIDGHAVCIVDEAVILDFGLGNVRKGYRRDFPWGTVCDYRRDGTVMGTLLVPGGETVTWKDDWQSPGTEAELARYAPHIDGLAAQYLERFR